MMILNHAPNNFSSHVLFVKLICIIAGEKNLVGNKLSKMFCEHLLGVSTWRKKQIEERKIINSNI